MSTRTYSDAALAAAVAAACSWRGVLRELGLTATSAGSAPASGGTLSTLRAHAHRLALSVAHLSVQQPRPANTVHRSFDPRYLRDATSHFVAAWFALRGATVSWPLEPCRYDLLVDFGDGISRIQVKTTESSGRDASVIISNSRRGGRARYEPGEIDAFFVLDAELTGYLIPYQAVAGYGHLTLDRYREFIVAEHGDLVSGISAPASP